jgi:hypothetical protein
MDHKQLREFSQKHVKTMNIRKIMRKKKIMKLNKKELQEKLSKVEKDQHNFFMRNNTKGNNSIMAQDTHPSRKKMMIERNIKKKKFENELKKKIEKKIKKLNQKRGNIQSIPKMQNVSILLGTNPLLLSKESKIFAFGSSMIASGVVAKESREQVNEREYKKLQNRKQMGKQYLEELKNHRIIRKKEILLGPRNTKILEMNSKNSGLETIENESSARTMLNIEMNLNQNKKNSDREHMKKKFIIINQPTRRKRKIKKEEKENIKAKKHINYLKTVKIGKKL